MAAKRKASAMLHKVNFIERKIIKCFFFLHFFYEWKTINFKFSSQFFFFLFFFLVKSSHALWFVFRSFTNTQKLKDSISSQQSENHEATLNTDESYASLLKDADKLKLMLLAWNYQNSAALRSNGNSSADLNSVSSLWEQYQNALGLNVTKNNGEGAVSPVSII